MLPQLKRQIRKNKFLCALTKPIYAAAIRIATWPGKRACARRLLNNLAIVQRYDDETVVWYFGVPTHMNLGDQAQKCCIIQWIRTNYPNAQIIEITSRAFNVMQRPILQQLREKIREQDLIVMQSGYTMTGVHPDEVSHRVIPQAFPKNQVLFFPQTILFASEELQKMESNAFEKNPNVTLLARDRISYESAIKYFPNTHICLFPDIVTSEIGKHRFPNNRSGILFCMRNDAEQFYEKKDIADLRKRLECLAHSEMTDTTVDWKNEELTRKNLWPKIMQVVDSYSKYRLIITDRYHGTIFSLIAGTPVVVLKTNDHKVVTGARWFDGVYNDYVFLAGSLNEAEQLAHSIFTKNYQYELDDYFDRKFYQKLKTLI